MPSRKALTSSVAALALAGYVLVARVAGDLYPFSTFGMYSQVPGRSASRVVARDAAGSVRELTDFTAFRCDRPIDLSSCRAGGEVYTIDYLDREARAYVGEAPPATDAPGPSERPVEVVRRIWHFKAGNDLDVDDCVLALCRAVAR